MKKTLQLFYSILSIVSLMIPAIPSEASDVDPYEAMVDMFETAENDVAARAANAKFDPNTCYTYLLDLEGDIAWDSEEDLTDKFERNCCFLKFNLEHFRQQIPIYAMEKGPYSGSYTFRNVNNLKNFIDPYCIDTEKKKSGIFEIHLCSDDEFTLPPTRLYRIPLFFEQGVVYFWDVGNARYSVRENPVRMVILNAPKSEASVPSNELVRILTIDSDLTFNGLYADNKKGTCEKDCCICNDFERYKWFIEPKKKYFPEAEDDEYFLVNQDTGESFGGKIVRSEKFSNLNQIFTFIGDNGQRFDMVFIKLVVNKEAYEAFKSKYKLNEPEIIRNYLGILDTKNLYSDTEFGVEQDINVCPIV